MDPSELQTDKDNDSKSLEGADTELATKAEAAKFPAAGASTGDGLHTNTSAALTADATSSNAAAPSSTSSPKPPVFKRLWQRFNVYLLLLILLVLLAIGGTATIFLKNRADIQKSQGPISTQDLSDSALKQLANTDVTVGSAKQILKVESNAIFAGSVLVRSDLEVAGTIKAGGELQLPSIAVTGGSRFNQLQVDTVAVGGSATVQGVFTAQKGINVSGNSNFSGALSAPQITTNTLLLNGDLSLTHHITAGGPVPGLAKGNALGSGGTASVSGSDTSGSLTFNIGSGPGAGCFATVSFARKFSGVPHVNVTPIGSSAAGLNYYVNRSTAEFSVCTTNPAPAGQTFGFDYIVLN